MQELPKFDETFGPILKILANGAEVHHRALVSAVREQFYSELPKEILGLKTKSGDPLLENRIAWGKSYLKKGGYVHYPRRGFVQITEKGRTAATTDIDLKSVTNDYLSFFTLENKKTTELAQIEGSTPQDLIDSGFTAMESQTKADLLEKLKGTDPYYFEKVILLLLKKMGYGEFVETPKSGDGGIDGIINQDELGLDKIYIQAKRYTENKVREKDIRNFIGAMSGDTTKGVFVTTSDFDAAAIKKAHDAHHTIILIDGIKLVALMHNHNIGVQIKDTYEVKEIDEDFFNAQ
jgi:restriction system protein